MVVVYHECEAEGICRVVDGERPYSCRRDLAEFRKQYAISVPTYWLTDD